MPPRVGLPRLNEFFWPIACKLGGFIGKLLYNRLGHMTRSRGGNTRSFFQNDLEKAWNMNKIDFLIFPA